MLSVLVTAVCWCRSRAMKHGMHNIDYTSVTRMYFVSNNEHSWCAPENAAVLGSGAQLSVVARTSSTAGESENGDDDLPACRFVAWPLFKKIPPARGADLISVSARLFLIPVLVGQRFAHIHCYEWTVR